MAFNPEVRAEMPAFRERKAAQWERIAKALPGLQLALTGGHEVMLTYSPHDDSFYESVIIGQLQKVLLEQYGSRLNPMWRDMADDKKPFSHKRIDLTDDQIDQVIEQWRAGKSALELPFVEAVYVHGELKTKP